MKVVWSRRAIPDLVHLREYIEKDSEQNAAVVAKRVLKAVDLLQTHPEIGRPGRLVGTRELVVPDTPYVIPYRVRRERLELIAVFHGRQKWRLADAKNRFTELVNRALAEGPQRVVRRDDAVIVLAQSDYEKLTGKRPGFRDFLMGKGSSLEGLDLTRDRTAMRSTKL